MAKVRQWLYLKDEEGIPIENAYLHLYLTGTETEVTLFSDSIGTSLDQSTWTSGTSGFFDFYIGNEWDVQGYNANQYFDLAWSLSPFNYLTDGNMETDPTSTWSAHNATLAEETTIVRNGSKSLKIADIGAASCGYQIFTTEIGVQYRVTGYIYIPAGLDLNYAQIYVGSGLVSWKEGFTTTIEDSWVKASFDFIATTTTTYIHLNCYGKVEDGSDYVFFDDVSIDRLTAVTKSGMIDGIQLFPFLFSVDETDNDTDRNKLLSNKLAYKFENHVDSDYPAEPHSIKPVDTNDPSDSTYDKVVTNGLMNEINGLLNLLLTCGGDAISVTSSGSLVETILLDTFTPSGDGYYADLVHTINRGRKYPILQFYEYLSDGYKDRPPIPGSPSAGSNQIIHPRAIQDKTSDTIRVWTVNDNWLMATVVASGS